MMKTITRKWILLRLTFFILVVLIACDRQEDFPFLKGPYLGQKPPGMTPELFAPGIISQAGLELHSSLTISDDGKEIYFTCLNKDEERTRNIIMLMKYQQGRWAGPQVAPFSGKYNDTNPSISGDGNRLFFSSNRPIKEDGEAKQDRDIWYLVKGNNGWSEPIHIEGSVNSKMTDDAFSVSNKGLMYFYRKFGKDEGWGEIFKSCFIDGSWSDPERLGDSINTKFFECFPVVSPDEDFLIFYRLHRSEGTGQYICFRQSDGTWTQPVNMGGTINGGAVAFSSSLSPDGKFLFVLRRRSDSIIMSPEDFKEGIYWVDAKIIEDFKPKNLKQRR